jgi:hypothetical protein
MYASASTLDKLAGLRFLTPSATYPTRAKGGVEMLYARLFFLLAIATAVAMLLAEGPVGPY